ncbi:MAG TPA: hypothetical protein VMV49_16640 [Candidatus Deferrimicrobium sp.]|nr:hypothetical protein [Candidatus Deferrimicrobium sp.]
MSYKISYENDSVEIRNANELRIALDLTAPEIHMELLTQLGEGISELIRNDSEFLLILRKVMGTTGQSKQGFLSLFGENLGKVVTKGETIARALAILANEEDQSFFLNALNQEGIRKCITTFYDVVDCLEWLFGKMDKIFLDLIGWDFVMGHVINTGENLGLLLKFLNEEEERELLEKMGWDRVLECIQTVKDFSYILIGMDVGNERTLIEKITTQKLRKVIPFKTDLETLCKHLSPADAKLIREKYIGE